MKYTKDDVIIWTDDPRLKDSIGKECWVASTAKTVLDLANLDYETDTFKGVSDGGFRVDIPYTFPCIILKKESDKKIVPFDLSLKEDRDAVIGKRICSKDCDTIVCGCSKYSEDIWEFELSASICPVDARYVMRDFVFADGPNKGKPVGKEIKE